MVLRAAEEERKQRRCTKDEQACRESNNNNNNKKKKNSNKVERQPVCRKSWIQAHVSAPQIFHRGGPVHLKAEDATLDQVRALIDLPRHEEELAELRTAGAKESGA